LAVDDRGVRCRLYAAIEPRSKGTWEP
jgi:hypothetical protein